jgi:hypothetical protein
VAEGPNPWLMLGIGLVVGLLIGLGIGYLIWHQGGSAATSAVTSPTASATPTFLPSESVTAGPTATAAPTATTVPVPAGTGIQPCPLTAPANQHPLGSPAGPGVGQHRDATLDYCGAGNAVLPAGSRRFITGNNWGLGIADSCPAGSSGSDGMGVVLTVTELLPGGGTGPDTATEQGDWVDQGGTNMSTGGNYQVQVRTVSSRCVWHISIYPS